MKALKEASHLKDYPKLASCFAPPYDGGGMKTLLEAAARYDLAFPRLYEAAGRKLQEDELAGPEHRPRAPLPGPRAGRRASSSRAT